MVAVLMECENEKQVSTVVDVTKNRSLPSSYLKLMFASVASKASDQILQKIQDVLGYVGNLTEEEISSELQFLIESSLKEKTIQKQRKVLSY